MPRLALYKTKVCPCGKPYSAKGLCKACYMQDYDIKHPRNTPEQRLKSLGYAKKYQKLNPEKLQSTKRATAKKRTAQLRERIRELRSRPCMDCDISYPNCVMEFDHARGEKLFDISKATRSWQQFEEEIAKCDVVCANCHRMRTFKRRQQTGRRKNITKWELLNLQQLVKQSPQLLITLRKY